MNIYYGRSGYDFLNFLRCFGDINYRNYNGNCDVYVEY